MSSHGQRILLRPAAEPEEPTTRVPSPEPALAVARCDQTPITRRVVVGRKPVEAGVLCGLAERRHRPGAQGLRSLRGLRLDAAARRTARGRTFVAPARARLKAPMMQMGSPRSTASQDDNTMKAKRP